MKINSHIMKMLFINDYLDQLQIEVDLHFLPLHLDQVFIKVP